MKDFFIRKFMTFKLALIAFIANFARMDSKNQTLSTIKNILQNDTSIDHVTRLILYNGLSFVNKDVENVMVPRSDIFGIKSSASIAEINQVILSTTYTRVLVYNENLDNIVGFIHIKDLYKNLVSGKFFQISDIIRTPITVVPSMQLVNVLAMMQRNRVHLAVVVDEYGCTVGIVTNEDIIEALVGKINDEHDANTADEEYQLLDSNTLIASARLKIETVEELLKIDLKDHNYDCETVGGMVIAKAGKIPEIGSVLNIKQNILVEVLDANKRVLKQIKIKNQSYLK